METKENATTENIGLVDEGQSPTSIGNALGRSVSMVGKVLSGVGSFGKNVVSGVASSYDWQKERQQLYIIAQEIDKANLFMRDTAVRAGIALYNTLDKTVKVVDKTVTGAARPIVKPLAVVTAGYLAGNLLDANPTEMTNYVSSLVDQIPYAGDHMANVTSSVGSLLPDSSLGQVAAEGVQLLTSDYAPKVASTAGKLVGNMDKAGAAVGGLGVLVKGITGRR